MTTTTTTTTKTSLTYPSDKWWYVVSPRPFAKGSGEAGWVESRHRTIWNAYKAHVAGAVVVPGNALAIDKAQGNKGFAYYR